MSWVCLYVGHELPVGISGLFLLDWAELLQYRAPDSQSNNFSFPCVFLQGSLIYMPAEQADGNVKVADSWLTYPSTVSLEARAPC